MTQLTEFHNTSQGTRRPKTKNIAPCMTVLLSQLNQKYTENQINKQNHPNKPTAICVLDYLFPSGNTVPYIYNMSIFSQKTGYELFATILCACIVML